MNRILSSDFHRTIRNPIIYILPVGLIFTLILAIFYSGTKGGQITISQVFSDAVEMQTLIMIAADIVLIKLWSGERKHGYIKNIAGNVSGRHILPISKMIVGITLSVVYVVFSFIYMICASSVRDTRIVYAPFSGQLVELLLWVLAGIASIAFMLMLYELFNSPTLCYIIAIMLWSGMLENLILQIVYLIFKNEFYLGRYMLILGMKTEESGCIEDLIRTLIYIAVFMGAAIFTARKKDVNA
ncbi:MAG: hypothetical protein J5824_08610 [Lachnospiraceae bacterium]|nr:hypothetical protein [Lachnospiraceae bacterium]